MRLFRCLALLLSLAAPAALAGGPYQVELVVFRQAGDAVPSSQPAPDDWARPEERFNTLEALFERLTPQTT